MTAELEEMETKLSEEFKESLYGAVKEKFGIELDIHSNLMDMRLLTKDGKEISSEQHIFIDSFSRSYSEVLQMVRDAKGYDEALKMVHDAMVSVKTRLEDLG